MHMFKTLLTTAFCLTALVSPVSAEYPDKPIRMVVGYAPGGAAGERLPGAALHAPHLRRHVGHARHTCRWS